MRAFFRSHAGKGTVCVYLTGVLLAWPPALSWLAAVACLCFAIKHFQASFRQLDTDDDDTQPGTGLELARSERFPVRS